MITRQGIGRIRFAALLALAFPLCVPARADDTPTGEYAVKAAMVYNFACFTEWPADAFGTDTEPLRLVAFGDEAQLREFAQLKDRSAAGRRIEVLITTRPEDAAGCHLLFLARGQRDAWPQIHAALADGPVLTVGEMNGFLESGGDMVLQLQDNKVRFQVNLDNLRAGSLQLSSRILKLATKIIDKRRQGS